MKQNFMIVSASTNKYEFVTGQGFSKFLDEPEVANFTVKEFFVHSNDQFPLENQVTNDSGLLSGKKKFMPENCEGVVDEKILDNFPEIVHKEEVSENLKDVLLSIGQKPLEPYARNFLSDDDFICSSSDTDSISSLDDGFLSDTDFGTTTEPDTLGIGLIKEQEYGRQAELHLKISALQVVDTFKNLSRSKEEDLSRC